VLHCAFPTFALTGLDVIFKSDTEGRNNLVIRQNKTAHKNSTLFNGRNYKLIILSCGIVFSYLFTSDKAPELGT